MLKLLLMIISIFSILLIFDLVVVGLICLKVYIIRPLKENKDLFKEN
jgi:hypothetical protein